jgi:hypothetical protein
MIKVLKYWRVALATATTLAFMAAPVHADPITGILIGAVGSIASGASAASVAYGLVASALSMGVNMLIAKIFAPKEKIVGVKAKLESGGDLPLSFIMGEVATAGKLVYVNQGGNDLNNKLTLVISLSELPVTSFKTDFWINSELCTIDTSVQTPSAGDFDSDAPGPGFFRVTEYDKRSDDDYNHQYCWVKFYDGTQTTADPYLLAEFGSDPDKPWTSSMVGRGCAYAIVVCRYSKKGIWSGVPEFKFVVRGIPLYDISKDSTQGGSGLQRWTDRSTWAYSENNKVMQYNIIRGISYGGKWVWGGQHKTGSNAEGYQLPPSYWRAAIAHCNENVSLAAGGTIKRYTAGCEIEVDQQPMDVIKELDKACNGYTSEYGGLWKTWAGPFGTSVYSFTDKNVIITEDQVDSLSRPIQETYNGARATYVRPSAGWVMKDAPARIFDDLVDEDGGYQLIADFDLPVVTNTNQAQRVMRTVVLDSRRQINHILQLPPDAYPLEPYDVINWNSDRNGYVNKKFVVTSIDDLHNCNQALAFRELNPSDYDWDTAYELPDSVGPLVPVRPGALALDFTATADQVDAPGGGKDKPAIRIDWSWNRPDIDLDFLRYEVRPQGGTKVVANGTIRNIEDGTRLITSSSFRFGRTYQVRAFAQPDLRGRKGTWTAWKNVTCVIVDVPSAPTLTRISDLADDGGLNFYVDVTWTLISQDSQYSIKVVNTTDSVTYFVRVDNAPATGSTARHRLPVTSGKSYTIYVRAIGADGGTPGDWSTGTSITVTKKNTAPTTPAGLAATGGSRRNKLSWTASPDADYKRTLVYASTTNDFTTATVVGRPSSDNFLHDGLANGATWYYWIVHQDRSGNDSAKHPTSNTAGVSATAVRIVEDDTDPTSPGTPTGVTLTQRTNLDEDGKAVLDLKITWSAPGGASATIGYEVNITDGTDVWNIKSDDRAVRWPVRSNVLYTVKVRAVSFNNVKGGYSSTATITPSKKVVAPTTAAGLTVASNHKRNRLKWTACPDTDYKLTNIYRNTTNSFPGGSPYDTQKGTVFVDDDLAPGTTYYYWVAHVDRSGNVGTATSSANGAAAKIVTADVTAANITTALIAPLAVTDALIYPDAVIPSKRFPQDNTNLIRDPELLEPGLWGYSGTGVSMTQHVNNAGLAPTGGSKYGFYLSTAAGGAGKITFYSAKDIPVEEGERYWARMYVGSVPNASSPVVWQASMFVDWYDTDITGAPNASPLSTATLWAAGGGLPISAIGNGFSAIAPQGAQVARLRVELEEPGAPASPTTMVVYSPSFRRQVGGYDYQDGDIMSRHIDDNAISQLFVAGSNATTSCAAGVSQLIESLAVSYDASANYCEVDVEFQNNSGTTQTMDVTLEDSNTAGASILRTWPGVILNDGRMFSQHYTDVAPSGTGKTYRLRATMVTAGTVRRDRIEAMVRNR